MAQMPDSPVVAKAMVTLFIEGTPEFIEEVLVISEPSPSLEPGDVCVVDLYFDTLLAEPGLFKQDNGTAVRHEAAWQASYTRSQNASVKARITTTSTPHGKRRQLEVDFRIEADLQPETVKGAELFLIRLLKRHFPHGSIAASWRADLGDQGVWYGDTQFAYNLIQPGVAGLHPQVHAGLVEHFSEPRWRLI
ncbi:hypothetical protein ACK129_17070 [Pseudomonas citrulli]|jgi:hypothetical protein|uniref:DUF1833 domain-containing protein n=1 Tax=Pseudomonas lurida TaxID=244566 RepID=A0ABY9FP90_9PSED|nr:MULTISPECIES: hypothetical protein [Pseudomonas]QDH66552.1 hypothetical protein FKZ69_21895 [Pseudomonas azotoformans]WLG54889.1 hypothetical protein PSH77_19710 [Pseudomonas extremorientalis]WLH05124.1 hypothetical protein PSH67_20060 [Pseudomonas lurida]